MSFSLAKLVFDDPYLFTDVDDIITLDEEREIAVGMAQDQIVTVIFTMRYGKCRIISARRATRNEQHDYYGQA
jgi:uncharacterized protein